MHSESSRQQVSSAEPSENRMRISEEAQFLDRASGVRPESVPIGELV